MYKDNLALGIKVRGRVLREKKDTVFLPFGTEYSVFIKNLNSVRAQCKISIDGVDIGYGTSFVVQPNATIEIERYVKNNDSGNKFKFIERTEAIENHRGIKLDDGLLRVEYQFEKLYHPATYYYPLWYVPSDTVWYGNGVTTAGGCFGGTTGTGSSPSGILRGSSAGTVNVNHMSAPTSTSIGSAGSTAATNATATFNDAGITVPGSLSTQSFITTSGFALEDQKYVMILKLTGKMGEKAVEKVITVRQKQTCTTCGRVNKFTSSFCSACGTSLKVI